MAFTPIADSDFNGKGAASLPDQPTISASELKDKFDEDAKKVVAPAVNRLINELQATSGAASLGAVAPTGRTGNTVQALLNGISSAVDAKSTITLSNVATSGVRIASVVIDGATTDLKAPQGGGGGTWGSITGTLSDQTDLNNALSAKADSSSLATVATSGSYTDLSNQPTIPSKVSDLANDSGYQTASDVATAVATKSNVEWNQITAATGNTKIATISIDGSTTNVYAPTSGGGGGGSTTFAGLDDVSLSGTPTAGQIVQYTTVGSDVMLQNVNMPSIPTVTDTYSGTSSDAMSGKAVKAALETLDGTVSGSPSAGKTLTAFSETDGKVSATFGNISITKSQVSDFPAIPDELADLTGDVAISSPTSGQILQHNGTKWANANLPQGGHTMIDNTTLINSMNAAITEGTSNDDVVSAYGIGKWSNVTEITYLVHGVSSGTNPLHNTGVGTWDDTFANESDWLVIADLVGILSDPTKHVEVVFDPDYFADDIPVFGGWLIDDTTGKICIKFANEISNADCLTGVVGVKITTDRTAVSWINGAPT